MDRLTTRAQPGKAALKIEATNEEDAKRELMHKYKLAMEKLAKVEDEEEALLMYGIIGKPIFDDKGRLFIPPKTWQQAGIAPGDTLRLTATDGKIIIKKETKK